MSVFSHPSFDEHENVVFCHDPKTNLKAIIAVHNTNLGPAVGGCRMWQYASDDDALTDVLRLSKGMTYKNAMAGLAMGGGKSVIIADPKMTDREGIFRSFGRFINHLGGSYFSAEDVGVSPADILFANQETPYVVGLEGKSGDPSPATAMGTYLGIKAAVKHKYGKDDLSDLTIAVQGLGHVGYSLCKHLHAEGAKLFVTDIYPESVNNVVNAFNATPVEPDEIYALDVDVYSPCALGATINKHTLDLFKTKIIAGCANNQLAVEEHDIDLKQRGILYAPDYVINAGGVINLSYEDNYDAAKANEKVSQIYQTLLNIFAKSDEQDRPTGEIANAIAKQIING